MTGPRFAPARLAAFAWIVLSVAGCSILDPGSRFESLALCVACLSDRRTIGPGVDSQEMTPSAILRSGLVAPVHRHDWQVVNQWVEGEPRGCARPHPRGNDLVERLELSAALRAHVAENIRSGALTVEEVEAALHVEFGIELLTALVEEDGLSGALSVEEIKATFRREHAFEVLIERAAERRTAPVDVPGLDSYLRVLSVVREFSGWDGSR